MKKYNVVFSVICLLVMGACEKKQTEADLDALIETTDLKAIREYKKTLVDQENVYTKKIKHINRVLDSLDPETSKMVSVFYPKDSVFYSFIEIQGSVMSQNDALITPESGGVLKLYVKEGQKVASGKVLGVVDDNGLRDKYAQAKLAVDQARIQVKQAQVQANLDKITFDKQKSLWSQKIGSEIQFLQAKTKYDFSKESVSSANEGVAMAQRNVDAIRKQVNNLSISAPFSGEVEQLIVKSGQVVGPGVPILRLIGVRSLKVVANLPEKNLTSVKLNTPVSIYIPSIDRTLSSKVSLVGGSINPNSRTFKVEIPIDSEGGVIKPNLVVQLKINDYTSRNVIVIPKRIISKDLEGNAYVFVIDESKKDEKSDGVVHKRKIKLGRDYQGKVEVLSGLTNSEKIVSEGFDKVAEGSHISIVNM